MTLSTIIDIADAVVSELNGGSFSQQFTAKRLYQPLFDLQQLKQLKVSVVPKAVEIERSDRVAHQYDYQIDVAVQKKFDTTENAELDPLMGLVEQIADFFKDRRLSAYPDASWIKTENLPWSPEHMIQQRVFTSVLTLTFRVLR